jgi:hypothetical protein
VLLVAIGMTAMLSVVALAVDLGMLFTARGEAQRVADAAALAGAAGFIEEPMNPEPRARELALEFAVQNSVRDEFMVLQDEDVVVDLGARRVSVTVRRAADRGNAVGTWFARVFGVDEVDVGATATAEAAPAGAATCLMPFTIPDAWDDVNDNQQYDSGEYYDMTDTGYGSDYRNGVPAFNGIDPDGTTYVNDLGRPVVLKEGKPQEAIVSSWYFPWDVPAVDGGPATGAARYRWNIANCNTSIVRIGEPHMVENGNMTGPTQQGVKDLLKEDPDAWWDASTGTVQGSVYGDTWKASARVVNLPLFDPRDPVEPGKKPVVFNNFASFFLEGMDGNDVIGRFLYASGIGVGTTGSGGSADTGAMTLFVRLVE